MMVAVASVAIVILTSFGLWVGIGLGLVGLVVLYSAGSGTASLPVISIAIWNMLYNFPLVALPLFIFMGSLFVELDLGRRVYSALTPLLERLPGKLLISNIVFCGLFGAASGSSMATAATVGSVAYPELTRKGYFPRALVGNLAGAGTLGILVPPSIPLIVYASLTNVSVGSVFLTSVVPALMALIMFILFIMIYALLRPEVAPSGERLPLMVAMRKLTGIAPMFLLIGAVMGTIYAGVATATEAAALGVIATALVGIFYGELRISRIWNALLTTSRISATVGLVIVGAMVFSMALSTSGIPRVLVQEILGLGLEPWMLLICLYLFYLLLGCFLGAIEIMVTTLPFTFPLVMALGYDPLWFGVVMVIVCEIGLITPPVGFNLFIIQSVTGGKSSIGEVARGSVPYFAILLAVLGIITVFPALTTYLPYVN